MSAPHRVRLDEVVTEAKSGFACGEEVQNGVFQIRMNNVTRDGRLDTTKKRLVPSNHKGIPGTLLKEGDVLFNATNSPDLVGKTVMVRNLTEPTVFSNHFLRLRTDTSRLDPSYLTRWLNAEFQRGTYKSMCRQWVNQATLGRDALLGTGISLLDLAEQRRIAEVLDQVDALREKRRKSIALLDDLAQSVFLDMFGSAGSEFRSSTVEELAANTKNSIRTGPFGSQLRHEEFVDEGIPVLGIDNAVNNEFKWAKARYITDAKYRQLQRYTVFPGDVLITIMGTCGRCAIVPDDIPTAINTKHLCCITLDQRACLPEYLHSYFLQHPVAQQYLRQTAKGAIMSGLNMGIIKSLPVALPPLRLQESYAQRTREIREARSTAERHLRQLDELFTSIQSRAFRGELWQDDLKDL
ncbi:restriction endonuclease subunit S [Nocardia sp. No.11]|uniref:restriction endonuclease subunit S n=1 Tax=Nocardia sp. No.11 TaxID=3128861 RepID=UPI00319DD250